MIAQLLQQDERGMEALLLHYGPLMRYIIAPILPDPQDREECLSEVSMRVWSRIAQFDPARGSWNAWLTAVTRSTALNYQRSAARHGGTQTLPRIVGERRAKEIILTGRPFTAQDACDWGILNRVVDTREELTEAVMETARTIARNAPLSVRQAKRSMHFGLQMDIRTALRFEVECYNQLVGTEDRREGIASFNEKRKPVFKGR